MKRPDIAAKKDRIDAQVRQWIDKHVLPYCQELLNQAQRKLRTRLTVLEGNGSWTFELEEEDCAQVRFPRHRRMLLNDAICLGLHGDRWERIRRRFPELCEINDIAHELWDAWGEFIGLCEATVPPLGS